LLEIVNCSRNSIENIEISQNGNLKTLDCRINNIASLDVSNNANLVKLNCSNNNISELKVGTKLKKLITLGNSNITTLNLGSLDLLIIDNNVEISGTSNTIIKVSVTGEGSLRINDDTIYLGAYNTNNVHVYSDNGSIYLRSNHGIVIGLASEVGSPRALLDVKGYNSSVIIGDTGGYSAGSSSARKLRLGLGTVGHKGSQYWTFCVDDTTSNSYLQIGYDTSSTAMSIRHDGLVDVSSFAIGGQVITFTT
jgi:hypothetical protein